MKKIENINTCENENKSTETIAEIKKKTWWIVKYAV